MQSEIENICNVEQAYTNMYPQAILVVNRRGTIRFISDEAVKLFECNSTNEVTGASVTSLIMSVNVIKSDDDEEDNYNTSYKPKLHKGTNKKGSSKQDRLESRQTTDVGSDHDTRTNELGNSVSANFSSSSPLASVVNNDNV